MRRREMRAALVAFAIAIALPITAAAESRPPCPPGQDCTVYDDWENENIDGRAGDGPGDQIRAFVPGGHQTLVRVRPHFIPELIKSVEDL
jgi:hypothetical protein